MRALAVALVYGVGGLLAVSGSLTVGQPRDQDRVRTLRRGVPPDSVS